MIKKIIKLSKKMSIRTTLVLSYVIITLMVVVLFSTLSYKRSVTLTVEQTNKFTYSTINEVNKRLNALITSLIDTSFFLCQNNDLINLMERYPDMDELEQLNMDDQIIQIVESYFKNKPEIANYNIIVKDKKFKGVGHNSVCSYGQIKNASWLTRLDGVDQALLENQKIDIFGVPYDLSSSSFQSNSVVLAYRIKNYKGKEVGYLYVDISESYIAKKLLNNDIISSNSKVYVLNKNGYVLFTTDKEALGIVAQIDGIDSILATPNGGNKRTIYGNEDILLVYSQTNSQGWKIISGIPYAEVYTSFKDILRVTLIIALIEILLSIPILLIFSNTIAKPIKELALTMKKFKEHDIKNKIQTDYQNEIGELISSYNIMLERINMQIKDIREAGEQKRQSDIKVLQAQINPHFLYNTLDSIAWNAIDKNVPEIAELLEKLGGFFRLSLNKGKSYCTVLDEITHTKYYLELQKQCHNDNIEFYFDMDKEAEMLFIPTFILQPLVENSIIHGFYNKKDTGVIKISVKLKEGKLILMVKDNGIGITKEAIQGIFSTEKQKRGYGVGNVNDRIQYYYGKEFGISFIIPEYQGLEAYIVLPVITEEDFVNGNKCRLH